MNIIGSEVVQEIHDSESGDFQRRNCGKTIGENSLIDISSSDAVPSDFRFVAAAGCSDALARFACCSVNSSTCLSSVGTVFLTAFEDERSLSYYLLLAIVV